jgi:ubiquitin C-terminal hydrolase
VNAIHRRRYVSDRHDSWLCDLCHRSQKEKAKRDVPKLPDMRIKFWPFIVMLALAYFGIVLVTARHELRIENGEIFGRF